MTHVLVLLLSSVGGRADAALLLAAGRSDGSNVLLFGLLGGAALIAVIGAIVWHRHHQLQQHHSHPALFQGLCEAHELDRASRRLLAQVLRCHRLSQPARLFTEPQWLEPSSLAALAGRAAELASLRSRLFAVAVTVPREETRPESNPGDGSESS